MSDTPVPSAPERRSHIADPGISGLTVFDEKVWRERCAHEPRVSARIGAAHTTGGIAILPLTGMIMPRSVETMYGTRPGLDMFMARFRQAVADDEVGAIIIRIASPGGLTDGVPEAAAEIFKARGSKPIWAVADHYAASGAYWIGSAADRLLVSPSGDVGSIGAFYRHLEYSKRLEADGVAVTVLRSAPHKNELDPAFPLGEDTAAEMQARVDDIGRKFEADVARNRGVKASVVRAEFGQGRMVTAQDAVKRGMADQVMSFDQAVAALARGAGRRAAAGRTRTEQVAPRPISARAALAFGRRIQST